jgi:molybdate transport system ATP-binding protein
MTGEQRLDVRVFARLGSMGLDVTLDAGSGTLVLVGPNGAGKSSLLSAVLGTLPVERGRIALGDDVLLDTATGVDVPVERRRLGYLPQDYALFPHLTVRGNVAFALASANPRQSRAERARRGDAILGELALTELAERRPRTLSGGEKQRAALARSLAVDPRALLLDEPLSALDIHSRSDVRTFLGRTLQELGLPAIVVTHDAADARELGQRIVVLESGKVTQTGTWDELSARPASSFVEAFVRSAR